MNRVAAVVLAAGPSRRLGRPKQLLAWRGGTLLGHAVRAALESGAEPVVVVTGAEAERVRHAVASLPVTVAHNERWMDGMGGSIATGVREALAQRPDLGAVIIMACDQPAVDAAHLAALAAALRPGFAAACSEYEGELGIPAAFDRSRFTELQRLGGERGARSVLEGALPHVAQVALPGGSLDVDTEADVARLEPPVLETERLRLRAPVPEDADAITLWCGDLDVATMTLSLPHPYHRSDAEAFIASRPGEFAKGLGLSLAVTELAGGQLAGMVGLRIEAAHERGELGYWLGKPFWGRGYATEASRAVLRWAFESRGLNRVIARVFTGNPASRRVLEKLGMRHEGRLRSHFRRFGEFRDADCFGLLREEWRASGR